MGESAQYQMEQSPQWPPRRRQQDRRAHDGCPECGGVEFEEGFCTACGLEVESILLSTEPEWRAFDLEQREKRTRVGAPYTQTIHDKGLSTIIDWTGRDIYGKQLKPEKRAQLYRLRKWNRRSKVSDALERNLVYALPEITKTAYKLNLPKVVTETASALYRRTVKERLIRGRSIQQVIAGTIYIACRQCGVVRTKEEVANAAHITNKECGRNIRFLLRKLELKIPRQKPPDYVDKLINNLKMSTATGNLAVELLNIATEMKLTSGRGPMGMAAAVVYMASILNDNRYTQDVIARAAGVTEVTIRNRYKELNNKLLFELYL